MELNFKSGLEILLCIVLCTLVWGITMTIIGVVLYSINYIIFTILLIIIFIVVLKETANYIKKENAFFNEIKNYRNFILATGNNTLEDISKEFGENIETVEANIQKAIDKHILKNVYLSKQTKEILVINKKLANKKVKGNIQNVNVENNVVLSTKGEN